MKQWNNIMHDKEAAGKATAAAKVVGTATKKYGGQALSGAKNLFTALFKARPHVGNSPKVISRRGLLTGSVNVPKSLAKKLGLAEGNNAVRNLTGNQLADKNIVKLLQKYKSTPNLKGHPLTMLAGAGAAGAAGYRAATTYGDSAEGADKIIAALTEEPVVEETPAEPKDSQDEESMLPYAGGGAAIGGLSSILYGKLKGRPDIQRDLLATLLGAGAGSAVYMAKNAEQEKEAWILPALAAVGPTVGYLGGSFLLDRWANKDSREAADAYHRAVTGNVNDVRERQQLLGMNQVVSEYNRQRDNSLIAQGLVGTGAGGAAGFGLSALYGKLKGKENLRRDLLAMLAGAGTGAALGVYNANKSKPEYVPQDEASKA